jgi:cobalt-zinc-cadmium efflux system outer membrane protein
MRSCRAPTSLLSLLLLLAVPGSRSVLAEEMQAVSNLPRWESASNRPIIRWVSQQPVVPAQPLVEPGKVDPEVVSPPEPTDRADALTLDDLRKIALESNPTLAQAAMAVQAAEGRYVQAGLYPNPSIGYLGGDIGLDDTSGQQGAVFGQEIVTTRKRRWARNAASWEIEQTRYAWEAQRRRVLNDVRAGYFEVLLAQKTIELNQQLVNIGDAGVRVAQQLFDHKVVSRADVLQARIEADMAKLGLNNARNRHQAAWRRLTAVLGQPQMRPQPLAGDVEANLPEFNWEDTLSVLLTQSPELGLANAGVERARSELSLQCAQRFPNFEVESWVKYDEGAHQSLIDVAVSIPLPLFDRNQGNVMAAQSNLIAASTEAQRVELDLRNRLASAFEQYANARRQVQTYTDSVLPNARESLRLTNLGYQAGEFGYVTLLTAQRTYFGVSLEYLNSLTELWASSVELEGMLLSGGLEARQGWNLGNNF